MSAEPSQAKSFPTTDYEELRHIARGMLRRERPGATLQATSLVNEAFLQLRRADFQAKDREHLVKAISQKIRRLLIDRARRHKVLHQVDADVDIVSGPGAPDPDRLERLDAAIERLRAIDDFAAQVLEARVHFEWTEEQTASEFGVSGVHVRRKLRFAKAWLRTELEGEAPSSADEE